jgi:MYXO-CTERM domain-containing protein
MNRGMFRALLGFTLALFALSFSTHARAAGSVRVASSTVEEAEGVWKLKLTMDYGSMPHIAHVPMVLSFTQTTLFERFVDDTTGDKPATRNVPLQNQTPIDLPMDVGFADMSGKMFKVTKFSFKLTREAGFEAGEYTLKVRLASGAAMGQPIRLRLNGNNKVINRKAIEFSASAPKPKPKAAPQDDPTDDGKPRAAEDSGPDLSDIDDITQSEADAIREADGPPGAKKRDSGCGCEVVGAPGPANGLGGKLGLWALAAIALALVLIRRRRH